MRVMRTKKVKVVLIGNDEITPEEEQKTWNTLFDLLLSKSNRKRQELSEPRVDVLQNNVEKRLIKNDIC